MMFAIGFAVGVTIGLILAVVAVNTGISVAKKRYEVQRDWDNGHPDCKRRR